jgi:uncharacterized secreted protein with C-terminal beta-propeller domain
MGGNIWDVALRSTYAYVVDRWFGLYVVDISNPLAPVLSGTLSGNDFSRIHIAGNYAFISARSYGLKIVNITNPSNPYLVATYTPQAEVLSSYVVGSYAYLAEGSGGLEIINIQNISNPAHIGYFISTGYVEDVYVLGNFAYIASGARGLEVLRVDNPSNPRLVGYYDTGDYGMSLVVRSTDTTVYLADSWDGLWIFDASDVYLSAGEKSPRPARFGLITNYPNPFNSSTRIVLEVKRPASYEVSVYNIAGQRLATIFCGKLKQGRHDFIWTPPPHTPSGIYFVRATDGQESVKLKTVLLK